MSVGVNQVTHVLVQKVYWKILLYAKLLIVKELPGNSEEKFIID
jgi:hypothetical protein